MCCLACGGMVRPTRSCAPCRSTTSPPRCVRRGVRRSGTCEPPRRTVLTRDLIRARVSKGELRPSFIDPDHAATLEDAEALVDTFRQAAEEQCTREALETRVADLVGDRRDHKILAGMAKVLTDRSVFSVESPIPPAELRE